MSGNFEPSQKWQPSEIFMYAVTHITKITEDVHGFFSSGIPSRMRNLDTRTLRTSQVT